MRDYSLSHVSDAALIRDLGTVVRQERLAIAEVLACIAEVDARKLYAPAGCSSMFVYCVDKLHFSEDAAAKRIQAARAARQYPVLFNALAEGRLHLSGVCLLAPHLAPETVDELIEKASHRRKSEIEDLLAAQYLLPPTPRPSPLFELRPAEAETLAATCEHAPGHVEECAAKSEGAPVHPVGSAGEAGRAPGHVPGLPAALQHVPGHVPGMPAVLQHAPGHDAPVAPKAPPVCQLTVRQSTRDKLRYAQAILSHAIPSGDLSDVLDRALELLITTTQRRRFGAGRPGGRGSRSRSASFARYIPAEVRHAVWERDQGRCTFVGTDGHPCNSIHFVEIDHVDPRRKENTVEGLRLRCRTHNQLEAERVFGSEFMARKREEARRAREEARRAQEKAGQGRERARRTREEARQVTEEGEIEAENDHTTKEQIRDVIAGLRNLGLRYSDAKRAAESTLTMDRPTLEDRMRAALSTITPIRQPQIRSIPPPVTTRM